MNLPRILLLLGLGTLTTLAFWPGAARAADQGTESDMWEDERPGGRRRDRGPWRLTDDAIERIMKSVRAADPKKADELARLRKKDPDRFRDELRRHGREEFEKIVRERIEKWRRDRRAEFVEWLSKNYPRDAESLAKLKQGDPRLYTQKFDRYMRRYGRIYQAERENPELAEVLKADYRLRERRDGLLRKIKSAKSEREKRQLGKQLEEVIGNRFDLIVRRKQIAYEQLLKKLEELQKQVKESRNEIARWRDDRFKAQNIKRRLEDLTEGILKFRWD